MNSSIDSSDAELVTATLRGSREAFGTLVERHQQFVCALAYAKTGSVAASEDIAQDTFVAAWKNLAALRVRENFRGWLCGTTRNLAAKFHRSNPASAPLHDQLPDTAVSAPSQLAMSHEEEAMLRATLDQLPETYREPLVLFYRGGQSVREIAEALKLSEDVVKQRLSRGRAMLREAIREKVESALSLSRPGAAFTIAVLAAIPALTSTAQAAGTGLAVAKGAGAVMGSGFLSVLGGLFFGVFGAWIGMKSSLDRAESDRERRLVVRVAGWTVAMIAFYMAALMALIYWAGPMQTHWPRLWVTLMSLVCLTFIGSTFLFGYLNTRAQQRVRVEERLKRGEPALRAADVCHFEYRSPGQFLGLAIIHIRLGGCSTHVAKGWFAYGTVAVSPLFAMGGIAVAPIALGGVGVGVLTTAALGLGLFSFSGVALGGVVLGGLAIGWIAIGGAAWGWLAAMGGQTWAGLYGMGRHVTAPHANDAIAKTFFHDNGLAQFAQWIADHGLLAQMLMFLPWALIFIWVRHLRLRQIS